jgi:hypothetical protein
MAYCIKCGTDLASGIRYCASCGTAVNPEISSSSGEASAGMNDSASQTPAAGMMSPVGSIRTCLSKYVDFSGRATRAEFWWWGLITGVGLNVVSVVMDPAVYFILLVAVFLPGTAVAARRLHDRDRSGWWMLVPIVNIVFFVKRGSPGTNSYGPPAR